MLLLKKIKPKLNVKKIYIVCEGYQKHIQLTKKHIQCSQKKILGVLSIIYLLYLIETGFRIFGTIKYKVLLGDRLGGPLQPVLELREMAVTVQRIF